METQINALIEAHKNLRMRQVLRMNAWKVRLGYWSFRDWKKHAQNLAYGQGPFRAR